MAEFLILYLLMSSLGWLWIIMGISTHRDHKIIREQERAHTTAKVLELIPEKKWRRRRRSRRREMYTVWHPVVEFAVEGRTYRLQSPANLSQDDFSVGDAAEIIYDAEDPTHFDFEEILEHDLRVAKCFIVAGIVWAVVFSPYLVNRALNG